jgi:hypothetical protein
MNDATMIGDLPACLVGAMGGGAARKALEALQAAGWQVLPPGEASGLHPFLDASTAHVGRRDDDILREWSKCEPMESAKAAPYRTIAHAYGYFVNVRMEPAEERAEYENEARDCGISEAFIRLQDYARERGCWWINLDRDADAIDGLPTHEW